MPDPAKKKKAAKKEPEQTFSPVSMLPEDQGFPAQPIPLAQPSWEERPSAAWHPPWQFYNDPTAPEPIPLGPLSPADQREAAALLLLQKVLAGEDTTPTWEELQAGSGQREVY